MKTVYLQTPISEEDVRKIEVGDVIYLSGGVFTGRSRIHRHVFGEGNALPYSTKERNAMIHVGPIMRAAGEGWELVSFMPTSSLRFERWGAESVERWGLRAIIGKTTMGARTLEAMRKFGCIHASPQCVSPNLWADSISVEGVYLFDELGSIEASWMLSLDRLGPFIVDMDAHGNNYFDEMDAKVAAARGEALELMGVPGDFEPTRLY